MARPPTDPKPVASTGGVANAQGQAIFTGDWNTLVNDYISKADTVQQTITRPNTGTVSALRVRADATFSQIELVAFLDNALHHGFRFIDGTGVSGNGQILSLVQQTGDTALLPIVVAETFTGAITPGALATTIQALFTFDPSNQQANGANSIFIGDDGTIAGTTTGNIKFLGAASSKLDTTEFTHNDGPFQGTTKTKAGLPVAADIPAGSWAVYKDTTGGSIRLWANDGGVMKSVALA